MEEICPYLRPTSVWLGVSREKVQKTRDGREGKRRRGAMRLASHRQAIIKEYFRRPRPYMPFE